MGNGVRTLVTNTDTSKDTEIGAGFGKALFKFLSALSSRKNELPLVLSMSLGSLSYTSCDKICTVIKDKYNHT